MRVIRLPIFLIALLSASAAVPSPQSAYPTYAEKLNADPDAAALYQYSVALHATKQVGRLSYRGCYTDDRTIWARHPVVHAMMPGSTGLAAVHSVFRDDPGVAVVVGPTGVVHVTVDGVPDALLDTHIATIKFDQQERYNDFLAIAAVENAPEMQAAMKALGIEPQLVVYDHLLQPALKRLPHMPRTLNNLTADEALDLVAATFGGIVVYRLCESTHVYQLDFSPVRDAGF